MRERATAKATLALPHTREIAENSDFLMRNTRHLRKCSSQGSPSNAAAWPVAYCPTLLIRPRYRRHRCSLHLGIWASEHLTGRATQAPVYRQSAPRHGKGFMLALPAISIEQLLGVGCSVQDSEGSPVPVE